MGGGGQEWGEEEEEIKPRITLQVLQGRLLLSSLSLSFNNTERLQVQTGENGATPI